MRIVRTPWSQLARSEQIISGATIASLLLLAIGAVGMALRHRPTWGKLTVSLASAGVALSLSGCSLNQQPAVISPQPPEEALPIEPTVSRSDHQLVVQELDRVGAALTEAQTQVQQLKAVDVRDEMIQRRNALLEAWIAAAAEDPRTLAQTMLTQYENLMEQDRQVVQQKYDQVMVVARNVGKS
jgi:hypothetical protein